MSTFKQVITSVTPPAITLASLGTASYATSGAVDNTVRQPLDLLVELVVTPATGTPSGNKQAVLFALSSLDGTNYQTGVNANDEGDMTLIGVLPLVSVTTLQRRTFSVAQSYGGVLPPFLKFVVKNDCGVAFASGTVNLSEVSGTVV